MDSCPDICRDAGKQTPPPYLEMYANGPSRIVEYATKEQAQNAVNTLSNQNLMGRLVYVREVRRHPFIREQY